MIFTFAGCARMASPSLSQRRLRLASWIPRAGLAEGETIFTRRATRGLPAPLFFWLESAWFLGLPGLITVLRMVPPWRLLNAGRPPFKRLVND